MIEICNLRKQKPSKPYDFIVDRTSPLGNPFFMKDESYRDNVCNKYQIFFNKQINGSSTSSKQFIKELQKLIQAYKQYGQLRLFCWCSPKRCHSETIREFILEKINKEQFQQEYECKWIGGKNDRKMF